jgi:hypothetical protein
MTVKDTLFKLSSYFILSSAFSLFRKIQEISSTDENNLIELSLGELNNRYREIDPELDEFNQIPTQKNIEKISRGIMVFDVDPISIH